MDEIYEMELHDRKYVDATEILRVPGGWIYVHYTENGAGGNSTSSCFVPFNNEFQKIKKDVKS